MHHVLTPLYLILRCRYNTNENFSIVIMDETRFFITRLEGMDVGLLVSSMIDEVEHILQVRDLPSNAFEDLGHNGPLTFTINAVMQGRHTHFVVFIETNGREDERNVTIYGKSGHVFGNNKLCVKSYHIVYDV